MSEVSVVTGSTACIPKEFAEEYRIGIIPFCLIIGDDSYRDGIDITTEAFYKALEANHSSVSTSTASIGYYIDMFEDLLDQSEHVLYVTLAAEMSGDYNTAAGAAEKLGTDRIKIFDSRTAATGQGQVAMEAAKAAKRGGNINAVLSIAEEVAGKVKVYAMIESFEYLKRSGRVSAASAFAANTLNIKPVFQFTRGEAKPVAKPRSKKRALERVIKLAAETCKKSGPLELAVFHVMAEDEALFLEERIRIAADCKSSFIAHFTPVMGKHTGPGLVGASFF